MHRFYYSIEVNQQNEFQLELEFDGNEVFGYLLQNDSGRRFDVIGLENNNILQIDVLDDKSKLWAVFTMKTDSDDLWTGFYENKNSGTYLPSTIIKIADYYQLSKTEGALAISAIYPQYSFSSVAALEYSEKLEEAIIQDLEDFWKRGKAYLAEDSTYLNSGWSRDINCSIAFFDETVSSIFYSIYEFTGGAHGMTYFSSENVAFDDQEYSFFGLAELLKDDEDCTEELSDNVLEELENQNADWVISGEITEFELSDLHVFTIRPDGLEFSFAPYEVSSYARGPHFVFLPYSKIYDCLDMLSPIGIFFR